MQLPNIYKNKNYKLLIVLPAVLILVSLSMLPMLQSGIDLKGGTEISLQTNQSFDANALQAKLQQGLGIKEVSVKTVTTPFGTSVDIELEQNTKIADAETNLENFYTALGDVQQAELSISDYNSQLKSGNVTDNATLLKELQDAQANETRAEADMNKYADIVLSDSENFTGSIDRSNATNTTALSNLVTSSFANAKQAYKDEILSILQSSVKFDSYSFQDVSPSLSGFFVERTRDVLIWSFIMAALLVVIIFRSIVPSIAVLLGAITDIVIALGGMSLFGIPLTLPSIATLLMLIGFSLDTDMLLTTRLLRRTEGSAKERAFEAMKTGLTMVTVSMVAFGVLFVLAIITQISTYYYISSVALFGLFGDIFATWCTNAVILLWYMERKSRG